MFGSRSSARWAVQVVESDLRTAWRAACEGAGVGQRIDTVSGSTVRTPKITSVSVGDPVRFLVELLPGQLAADLVKAAHRIAPHIGGTRLRVTPDGLEYVLVEVLTTDPLAVEVPAAVPVRSALDRLVLGVGEDGRRVTLDLAEAAHIIVQGTTGGGKSVALYSLLGQLTRARDVRVTGIDPTGLLLGPWCGRWGDVAGPVCGTADPGRYLVVLDRLVVEMDRRIAAMPAGRDRVELGEHCPLLLVVLEEYPGVLRLADTAGKDIGRQVRALVARLLSEGRKAGIRCVLVAQRADASVIGGFERSQASHRLSFRVDSRDALAMLHSDVSPDQVAEHVTAAAGVALLTAPGVPLTRIRGPYLSYADYCNAVTAVDLRSTLSRDQHRPVPVAS